MTNRLEMCTRVKDSATQEESQNFTRPLYKWFAQHLTQVRGVYCQSPVDSLGSGQ